MRKITNNKKFYNTISKTGLATFIGSAAIVSKNIADSVANYDYPNKIGLFLGIGIMYTGLYAHIYSHLNKSKYSKKERYIDDLKNTEGIKEELLKEKSEIKDFEKYLSKVSSSLSNSFSSDLALEANLVNLKLALLDLEDKNKEYKVYDRIRHLEKFRTSELYNNLKEEYNVSKNSINEENKLLKLQ